MAESIDSRQNPQFESILDFVDKNLLGTEAEKLERLPVKLTETSDNYRQEDEHRPE